VCSVFFCSPLVLLCGRTREEAEQVRLCASMHAGMQARMYGYTHVCMNTYMDNVYGGVHLCMITYMDMYGFVYGYIHGMNTHMDAHLCANSHMYISEYLYTYLHLYT